MEKIKDLRFKITENMENIIFETLSIKQLLKEKKLTKKKIEQLQNHLQDISKEFVLEFRENNVDEIESYNKIVSK